MAFECNMVEKGLKKGLLIGAPDFKASFPILKNECNLGQKMHFVFPHLCQGLALCLSTKLGLT